MASLYHNWKLRSESLAISKTAKKFFLGFTPIIHEQFEDANHKNSVLKAIIYCKALKTIFQYTYPYFSSIDFKKIKRCRQLQKSYIFQDQLFITDIKTRERIYIPLFIIVWSSLFIVVFFFFIFVSLLSNKR